MLANYSISFFAVIILLIVIIGTLSFYFVEKRDLFSSFYFTTVTMATVGYGDMAPVSYGGKILAILYGFMGAPLFIGFTGMILQSKFQKVIKTSIHEYHKEIKEVKEAKKIVLEVKKENKKQNKKIKKLEKEIETN